jgi:hypothetical protein
MAKASKFYKDFEQQGDKNRWLPFVRRYGEIACRITAAWQALVSAGRPKAIRDELAIGRQRRSVPRGASPRKPSRTAVAGEARNIRPSARGPSPADGSPRAPARFTPCRPAGAGLRPVSRACPLQDTRHDFRSLRRGPATGFLRSRSCGAPLLLTGSSADRPAEDSRFRVIANAGQAKKKPESLV